MWAGNVYNALLLWRLTADLILLIYTFHFFFSNNKLCDTFYYSICFRLIGLRFRDKQVLCAGDFAFIEENVCARSRIKRSVDGHRLQCPRAYTQNLNARFFSFSFVVLRTPRENINKFYQCSMARCAYKCVNFVRS